MQSTPPAPVRAEDSLAALLANRAFGFYLANRASVGMGMTLQTAVVAWQVYELTGSALPLALLGLARFVPHLIVSFLGGAIADTTDRRLILGVATIAPIGVSTMLWLLTGLGAITLTPIYAGVAVMGLAAAFEGPARVSLLPQVVPRAAFQRAIALATMVQQVSMVLGPASGGLIIARFGVAPGYLTHVLVLIAGLVCLPWIRIRPESNPQGKLSLGLIAEGLRFIWTHPVVLGAMALDLFAVIFANADALLPIFAKDILQVGPEGYGLLSSSKATGALLMSIALVLLPAIRSTGRTLILTVIGFGVGTIGFGMSTWFILSLLLYGLLSAFDQVSVVLRQTIIQLGTPDALRGRVSSVNAVFVGASNQLGAVRAGLVATWTGDAAVAVVSGGILCLASVAVITLLIPSLWRHRVDLETEEPRPAIKPA